ncbi:MAG TPA: HypC/HybG/HupF family hydrogenase formation chaperone [Thermohalobaculum sp.]|nr:HypC/HybG/HupF family hydrogenase formation chaperone [Thermohalobaculum sp.]
MCLGVPAKVTRIVDAERYLAMVDVSGVERETNVICVASETGPLDDLVGEWVLLHVGFAMSRIDAEEAERTLEVLRELGDVAAELDAIRASRV